MKGTIGSCRCSIDISASSSLVRSTALCLDRCGGGPSARDGITHPDAHAIRMPQCSSFPLALPMLSRGGASSQSEGLCYTRRPDGRCAGSLSISHDIWRTLSRVPQDEGPPSSNGDYYLDTSGVYYCLLS